MIMIDIPFNPDYEVGDAELAYVRAQFWAAIHQLEEITGSKWTDERFKEVMEYSGRSSRRGWKQRLRRVTYRLRSTDLTC